MEAPRGSVAVEVLDERGEPLPGFAGADCTSSGPVDSLRLRPRCKNHADLTGLKGRVIRLRFRLDKARLFAFQVKTGNGGRRGRRTRR